MTTNFLLLLFLSNDVKHRNFSQPLVPQNSLRNWWAAVNSQWVATSKLIKSSQVAAGPWDKSFLDYMSIFFTGRIPIHRQSVHLKLKSYSCSECSYATAEKRSLVFHVKTIHAKVKDYECQQCDYKTTSMWVFWSWNRFIWERALINLESIKNQIYRKLKRSHLKL